MSGETFYQRNKPVILQTEKDYYENNKKILRERAKNKYRELSEEEKGVKGHTKETDIITCLIKKQELKEYQRNYHEYKKTIA